MPRFENFIVDPWKGAREGQAASMQQNMLSQRQREHEQQMSQRQSEMQQRNQLYQQQMTMDRTRENRLAGADRRQAESHDAQYKTMQLGIAKNKAGILGSALQQVDQNTYAPLMQQFGQMVESGVLEREWLADLPNEYDPEAVGTAAKVFQNIAGMAEKGRSFAKHVDAGDRVLLFYDDGTREEVKKGESPKGSGSSTPDFEKRVNALMAQYPELDRGEITKIATGVIKVQKDPVTGEITIVDLTTGSVRTPSVADAPQEAPPERDASARTLWESADLSTGPVSAARAAASVPSGIAGGPVAKDTLQARQFVVNAQNDLVRALSINPRFPVGEINRIREEINIAPSVLDNSEMLKNRMVAIEEYLGLRLDNEKRASTDTALPADQRRAARNAAREIENFIRLMGVPNEAKRGGGVGAPPEEILQLIDKYTGK